MKIHKLLGKIAADKNSRELGQIIGLKKLPKESNSKEVSLDDKLYDYLVIRVHRIFRKDLGVPVAAEKIIKVEGNYVWFDILIEKFKASIKDGERVIERLKGDPQDKTKWNAEYGAFLSSRDER
jgi:hypothetical protein